MSNAVEEAIDQIKSGLDALAEAVGGGGSSAGSDDSGTDADEPWTEEQLKSLDRDDLLAAAEAAKVEVKKGQKASTIIPAILAKQEADAASGDTPDNDDPDNDPDPDDKKSKKDKKKSKKDKKGAGKSKGRGKS